MFDSVPTSPRSSIPETDIRHRTPVPDNGSWPRKGGGADAPIRGLVSLRTSVP